MEVFIFDSILIVIFVYRSLQRTVSNTYEGSFKLQIEITFIINIVRSVGVFVCRTSLINISVGGTVNWDCIIIHNFHSMNELDVKICCCAAI